MAEEVQEKYLLMFNNVLLMFNVCVYYVITIKNLSDLKILYCYDIIHAPMHKH